MRSSRATRLAVVAPSCEIQPTLDTYVHMAQQFAGLADAPGTKAAYESDLRQFAAWCADHGVCSLPASGETLAAYLAATAMWAKTSTIARRISAISRAHKKLGLASPTQDPGVRIVWRGIQRAKGVRKVGKAAILRDELRAIVTALESVTTKNIRDRALLLTGFSGGLRRSELVGLDVRDIEFVEQGMRVTIRRSKTDQLGAGRVIAIPDGRDPLSCPRRNVQAWLSASGVQRGPLFRRVDRHGNVGLNRLTTNAVALVVKAAVASIGHDPTSYAGHSLRSGFATSAAAAGASERAIMAQTGHRCLASLAPYIKAGTLWDENAASAVAL